MKGRPKQMKSNILYSLTKSKELAQAMLSVIALNSSIDERGAYNEIISGIKRICNLWGVGLPRNGHGIDFKHYIDSAKHAIVNMRKIAKDNNGFLNTLSLTAEEKELVKRILDSDLIERLIEFYTYRSA